MSEEIAAQAAEEAQAPVAAQEQAAPASETAAESTEEAKPDERRFTQAELDAIVAKEKAKAERRARREAEQRQERAPTQQETQGKADDAEPKREQFETYEDYVRALGRYEARVENKRIRDEEQQSRAAERQQKEAQKLSERVEGVVERGREAFKDFDAKIEKLFKEVQVGPAMYAAMVESSASEQVCYHLATHLDEADEIAAMSPTQQALAIGRLESRLESQKKSVSKAPPPVSTVRGSSSSASSAPSDNDSMEDWVKKERARLKAAGRLY